MYLRTTKRKNKDGSEVEYYQLAHNIWNKETNQAVAKIIHNFGRADNLDRNSLVRLCKSIARVCGLEVNEGGADHEQRLVRQDNDLLPHEVKMIRTQELGAAMALEVLWDRLGIGPALKKIIKQNGYRETYERALLAMTVNRLCEPESKLGVWDRWLRKVYLPSCRNLKLDQMYEAMDFLHAHSGKVEEAVFFRTAHLFNLDVDLIFYDTTTAAFSIDEEDGEGEDGPGLRRYGHPKNGVWSPQVVIALAVTREGLPVRSWIFPGNTSDINTVKKVKADLRDWNLGRTLFVADSGMNSQDNRQELAKACGKFLLAVRLASVKEVKEAVLRQAGRYKIIADNLHAQEIVMGDGERRRRYILCYNPQEAKRQRRHRQQVIQELELALSQHPHRQATAKWAINLMASGRYKRYLHIVNNSICLNYQAIQDVARYDGKWVLITNDDTITLDDAASGYKGLLVIERCFRTIKSAQIEVEPMYHWLPQRIEAHIKICVLALLLARAAELKCNLPWPRIKEDLSSLQATEFHTPDHRFFQRNEPSKNLLATLKSLEIPLPKVVLDITSHTTDT